MGSLHACIPIIPLSQPALSSNTLDLISIHKISHALDLTTFHFPLSMFRHRPQLPHPVIRRSPDTQPVHDIHPSTICLPTHVINILHD